MKYNLFHLTRPPSSTTSQKRFLVPAATTVCCMSGHQLHPCADLFFLVQFLFLYAIRWVDQ